MLNYALKLQNESSVFDFSSDSNAATTAYQPPQLPLNAWIEASTGISISNPQLEAGTLQQLCAVTQQRCTGSNTQWTSADQCAISEAIREL
jgi:hypothetical protein